MTTIALATPFKRADGVTVSEINLRRPTVKDLRRANSRDGSDFEKGAALIACLADLAPDDLDRMDAADYMAIQKQAESFLSPRES